MKRIDKLIFGLLFGFSFPLLFALMSGTIWFYWFQNYNVIQFVISGLIIGILADIALLKKLIYKALDLPIAILAGFYIFYNICMYGFFMGFPVFNLVMGVIAGYYFGIKIICKNIPFTESKTIMRRVSIFTGIIMFLNCVSTGIIALSEKTLGIELKGMFGLGFEVTRNMIIAVILIGGITLIVTQYCLTKIIMTRTINKYQLEH